jgi:phytoene synthase
MNQPQSAALAIHARKVLAHHGRTFALASLFLSPSQADDIALLYAFCRRIDDLVDEKPANEAREALASLRLDLAAGESGDPTVSRFLAVARKRRIDPTVLDQLFRGLEGDLGSVRVQDEGELIRYAYRVAGTVGLMCCDLFEVDETRARPFAVDLGIAMQLTNIARDVIEDAHRDRLYLPRVWLPRDVSLGTLIEGRLRTRVAARVAIRRVLALAERFYRSADNGMLMLPVRARMAVLAASRNYEAIGNVIRRQRDRDWGDRAKIFRAARIGHTLRAATAFTRVLVVPRPIDRCPHDPTLHRGLHGLPGADDGEA